MHKFYCFRGASFHLHPLPSTLYLWTSMSCIGDGPLAIGYYSFHGSYKDYFGKQLTLAGIFDFYFLMSCGQCTSYFLYFCSYYDSKVSLCFFYGTIFNPAQKLCPCLKESHCELLIYWVCCRVAGLVLL